MHINFYEFLSLLRILFCSSFTIFSHVVQYCTPVTGTHRQTKHVVLEATNYIKFPKLLLLPSNVLWLWKLSFAMLSEPNQAKPKRVKRNNRRYIFIAQSKHAYLYLAWYFALQCQKQELTTFFRCFQRPERVHAWKFHERTKKSFDCIFIWFWWNRRGSENNFTALTAADAHPQ